MSGLFGGGGSIEATRYNALQLQSSSQGLPIPIVYGRTKAAANLIWYGNFQAIRHEEEVGGKGGGGATSVTYTYRVGVLFGICEGQIGSYGKVYLNQGTTTPAGLGLTEYYGTAAQTPFGYLTTAFPDQALAYRHTAYLATSGFDLGNSPYLPQMWFEVTGLLSGTGVLPNDADPALVIEDFLTNPRYGAGLPAALIDQATLKTNPDSYQKYVGAMTITFSDALIQTKSAREYVQQWLDVTNTAAVWSADKLKFIPFGDKTTTANGVTFIPNKLPVYALNDNDFLADGGDDPVMVSRADPYDCHNHFRIQYRDKNNDYNAAVVESKDQASIEEIGLRTADQIDATFLSNNVSAQMCVDLMKNRQLYVRNRYRFRLSWEYALLEPMDIVTLTQADTGLNAKPARILSIEEDDGGLLTVEAEEFIDGVQWSPQNPAQQSQGFTPNSFIAPGDAATPVIFEPTSALLNGAPPEIWLVTNGNPATWGGARVWISLDDVSYFDVGEVATGARLGTLDASFAAFSGNNPDTGTTLAINSLNGGTFTTVSAADASAFRTLMWVGGELLSYQSATLTAAGKYDLSTLYRNLYGTQSSTKAAGAAWARLDDRVFKYRLPAQSYVGRTLYVKLTSFNIFGQSEQTLDNVPATTYTVTGIGSQSTVFITGQASGTLSASQQVINFIFPYAAQIPAALSGTLVAVGTNPTATATFSVEKNGAQFGAIQISTAGVVTLTAVTATNFAVGDVLRVVAPNPADTTLANLSLQVQATKL